MAIAVSSAFSTFSAPSRASTWRLCSVTIAVGLYRFTVTQEVFLAWADGIKQEAGFDKPSVVKAIRERLGL